MYLRLFLELLIVGITVMWLVGEIREIFAYTEDHGVVISIVQDIEAGFQCVIWMHNGSTLAFSLPLSESLAFSCLLLLCTIVCYPWPHRGPRGAVAPRWGSSLVAVGSVGAAAVRWQRPQRLTAVGAHRYYRAQLGPAAAAAAARPA